jgi:hypothetical protein
MPRNASLCSKKGWNSSLRKVGGTGSAINFVFR